MNNKHQIDNCNACCLCILKCSNNAIGINTKKNKIYIDRGKCINCFLCKDICPVKAIKFVKSNDHKTNILEFNCHINKKRLKSFFNITI